MAKNKLDNYPQTIDISLTGQCQLNCAWCWGELHTIGTLLGAEVWKELLGEFRILGTSAVVFTGGETLASPILPEVLRYAKETLLMRTTLSTNAILLNNLHEKVLPWVDDLGLPLDGSTSEINKKMRAGYVDNFPRVIDGIKLVLKKYPSVDLTVRTVIARPNINDVENIPQNLINNGINLSRIRYKLYQVEPIGPRAIITNSDEWRVTDNECKFVESKIIERYPGLAVTLQLYKNTSGRYYQIGPKGNAYGTFIDKDGVPQTVDLGNPVEDFDGAINLINSQYSFVSTH